MSHSRFAALAAGLLLLAGAAQAQSYPRIEGDADNQHTVYAPGGDRTPAPANTVGGGEARFIGSVDGRAQFEYREAPTARPATSALNSWKAGESSQG